MKLKFYFESKPYADELNIYLIGEDSSGRKFIAEPLRASFKLLQEGGVSEPTLEISGPSSREFLPALAKGLVESGYRADSSDAGELRATKSHLEDMRKLVLRGLGE